MNAAMGADSTRPITPSAASSTQTWQPRARAEDAISSPITPAPMHTTLAPGTSLARMAAASSCVRSSSACSPPGTASARARPPVAISSLSHPSTRPSDNTTSCAAARIASTRTPSAVTISRSASFAAVKKSCGPGSASASSASFDSGGRS